MLCLRYMGDSVSKQVSKCKESGPKTTTNERKRAVRRSKPNQTKTTENRIQHKRTKAPVRAKPKPPPPKKTQPKPPPKKSKPRPPPLKKITVVEEPVNEPVNEYLTESEDLRTRLDEEDYSMMTEFLNSLESSDSDSPDLENPDETFHIKDSTAYEWVVSVNPDK